MTGVGPRAARPAVLVVKRTEGKTACASRSQPEFVVFAREQVAAGVVASEEEAAAAALRDYLHKMETLRALVDPALAALDRGDSVDGPAFMRELLEETKGRMAGSVAVDA